MTLHFNKGSYMLACLESQRGRDTARMTEDRTIRAVGILMNRLKIVDSIYTMMIGIRMISR